MYKVRTLTKDGYRDEYAYSVDEFLDVFKPTRKIVGKKYIDKPVTFDIETTTIEFNNEDKPPKAFMYHWQMCIEGLVVFGRVWSDWCRLLEKLEDLYRLGDGVKLVCYVHNLSFEYEFFRQFYQCVDCFFTDIRKPLKVASEYIEFRCSYMLSNMSLEKFIENTPNTYHIKAKNDLDYRTIRTPKTKLTEIELGYCYNDVLGLYECLIEMGKYDNNATIPLTSTGFVRRDCKMEMRKDKRNRRNFVKTQLTELLYILMKEAFRGGNTASNRMHTNKILYNVDSYDISSSYPFQMVSKYFPIGTFIKYDVANMDELERYNSNYCTIGRYYFENLRLKENVPIPYIAFSKCLKCVDGEYYNGRVLKCDIAIMTLTEIDYEIIRSQYDFDELRVSDYHYSRRGLLPKELINTVLHYFSLKSELKGDKEHEYEYFKAKNKVNSLYGMLVTDIVHNEITCNLLGEYNVTKTSIDEGLEKYYKSWNSFLSYQWGIWVTAHARKQLQTAIDLVGTDVVYCDTDSVKYLNNHDDIFEKLNNEIQEDCDKRGIVNYAKTKNNGTMYLGMFDKDGSYDSFKTLGAKKYAYFQGDHLGVTVAGLSKKEGAKELERSGGLEAFTNGKVFVSSGRTVAYYNNEERHIFNYKGEKIETASNIAIVDTTYTLGITDTMLEIINRYIEEV